ncbi:hypothetical protein ACKR6V_003339 [Morganella morganii]
MSQQQYKQKKAEMTGFMMETKSPVRIAAIQALLRLTVNAHGAYGMTLISQIPQ